MPNISESESMDLPKKHKQKMLERSLANREVSVFDAAQLLGVTERTVLNFIKAKQIKAVKVGKRWFVNERSLLAFGSQVYGGVSQNGPSTRPVSEKPTLVSEIGADFSETDGEFSEKLILFSENKDFSENDGCVSENKSEFSETDEAVSEKSFETGQGNAAENGQAIAPVAAPAISKKKPNDKLTNAQSPGLESLADARSGLANLNCYRLAQAAFQSEGWQAALKYQSTAGFGFVGSQALLDRIASLQLQIFECLGSGYHCFDQLKETYYGRARAAAGALLGLIGSHANLVATLQAEQEFIREKLLPALVALHKSATKFKYTNKLRRT